MSDILIDKTENSNKNLKIQFQNIEKRVDTEIRLSGTVSRGIHDKI